MTNNYAVSWRKVAVLVALIACQTGAAQQSDVTFFVIGKHGGYLQGVTGARESLDYSFFAEIFLTADGDASNATLTLPDGEQFAFVDKRAASDASRDNILLLSGEKRYAEYADLQIDYPDGQYVVSFATPSGPVSDAVLTFDRRELPSAPRISLVQYGNVAAPLIDTGADVIVTWTRFREGRKDPNGILDDLIFVIVEDEDGNRVAHSGRPFEDRPYLTYADSTFTIDANTLNPDSRYTLVVEHAILDDTGTYAGIPAMTTRAVTTKTEIITAPVE